MKIDLYKNFDDKIEKIWIDFEKKADMTPFQSFDLIYHWYESIGKPLFKIKLRIFHVYNSKGTVAILPLCIRNSFGFKILEWIGLYQSDYMGPLFLKDYKNNRLENIWSIIDKKIGSYDLIYFQKQKKEIIEFLKKISFKHNINNSLQTSGANLTSNWDDYFNSIKKRIRYDSRRQERRLKDKGQLKFLLSINSEEKLDVIKCMMVQKSRRYRQTKIWDMLSIKEYKNYYSGLSKIKSNSFEIHCSSLVLDSKNIASHVGIVDQKNFYYLMPSHEGGEWEKYSPGRLLLIELIKWSIKNNKSFFDFTVGAESYKNIWCDFNQPLFECLHALSLKGNIFKYSILFKNKIKHTPIVIVLREIRSFLNS